MMSGASIAAGKSLSRGGSVVMAAGTFCARAVVANSASRSDAAATSLAIRESFVGVMARHFGGFWRVVHRKSFGAFGTGVGFEFAECFVVCDRARSGLLCDRLDALKSAQALRG